MKLTAKTIDGVKLPPGHKEVIKFDDEIGGFGLRIREGGSRVFIYQYKFGTQHRRLTLGTAVKEAFPDIRKRVIELQSQVRLGNDPALAKEVSRKRAGETFKVIAQRYLGQKIKTSKPRSYVETERYLLTLAKPLHGKPLAAIQRRDIAELLSSVAANVSKGTGEVTANRLRGGLSAMFTWAMREGLTENNPVTNTTKRSESARDRVLTDAELTEIWKVRDDTAFGRAVGLLMLTAQRRSEIGGLRWDEIDEETTRIILPKHRTKNGLEHIVSLSEPARAILNQCKRIVDQDGVFSSSEAGYGGWNKGKEALDQRLLEARRKVFGEKALPMPGWTLHDVRRSVATGMAKLGVLPHVIEAVLNHISGHKAGVAGIYNRNTYEPEKRAALTLWAEHLMAAVNHKPAKVVPMKVA